MIHHRTAEEVRRFDIGKLIVLLILIALLLLSWFRMIGQLLQPVAPLPTLVPTAMVAPTVAADSALPAGEVVLTGTAEPVTGVVAAVNGEAQRATTAGDDGTWSVDRSVGLRSDSWP
jgi:hypothetical protein